jgi:myosin heavy chain 9/10/11/14
LQVRPLLAATRNDEELRRKSLELAMANERAERDARERETLATLKMELEADKRRIEEALAAEQLQSADREAILQRTLTEKVCLWQRFIYVLRC